MVTSPETSIMGESLDDIHSGNDVEKTVQNSPGAEVRIRSLKTRTSWMLRLGGP